jgi:D-xylose transport system substrate-binding protein
MRGSRSREAVPAVATAAVVVVLAGLLAAACASPAASEVIRTEPVAPSAVASSTPAASPTAPTAPGCVVGVSWNLYGEERYAKWDEPGIKHVVERAGGVLRSADARASSDQQSADVDSLVAGGAKVIVVHAQDTSAILPAVQRARSAGVSVIAYDWLIEDPHVLFVTYDAVETGRMEARAILAAKPTGNYAIIKGDSGNAISDLQARGIHEILQPAVDRGDIHVVAETYTKTWDPYYAQTEMTAILGQNANRVDAVIAESDGMADGVVTALRAAGLDGKVSLAGQGGDVAALNRIALGIQTVDVWPNPKALGAAAGEAAVELCNNPHVSRVSGVKPFTSPGGNELYAIQLEPEAITQANLKDVLEAGWTDRQILCLDVDPANAPPVCQ